MKHWTNAGTARIMLAVFMSGLILSSCKKEEDIVKDPGTAPALPPSSTFVMDFSSFPTEDGAGNGRMEETKWNHFHAAANFVFWQSLLGIQMAVPVLAFKAAIDQEATYIPDEQRWNWSYDVSDGMHTYQANLYAKPSEGTIAWEMYISKSGVFEDFLWYKGTSALDGSEGTWTVSIEPEKNPREALFIEWEREDEEVASIKYTLIDQTSEHKDSYIAYGKTNGSDFDSFYHVYLASEDNLMKIDYNSETKAGRVMNPKHYQDDAWRCWNSELVDIDCGN